MIDVMGIKLKVIEAACGITALSEVDLLHRLEALYIDGMKAGADALRDATVAKAAYTPHEVAQILCDNSPRCGDSCTHISISAQEKT